MKTQIKRNSKIKISPQVTFSDKEGTYQDWKLLNQNGDYKMFEHLWNTGYFEKNPITSQMLTDYVSNFN